MKISLYISLFIISVTQAQTDYNTKKGFIAEGFDVVSYFENKAEKGNKKFTTTYDGVKLKFISKDHLSLFTKQPEKYMPQYGGYCAYAIAEKGRKVSINPKTFEIRDGKLYLFYNSWGTNTLKSWLNKSPITLVNKADKQWHLIKNKD